LHLAVTGLGKGVVPWVVAWVALWVLDLALLDRIPWLPAIDEGSYASAAFRFAHTGRAGVPMAQGLFGMDQDLVMYGRIPAAAVGLALRLGGIDPAVARAPALFIVTLTTPVVFAFARRCQASIPVAGAAALLWYVSVPARLLAHTARPDPFILLFAIVAAWFFFQGLQNGRPAQFLLTGLVAGASLEAHMVGSALALTLGILALALSPSGRRIRNALLLVAGALPPALVWLAVHVGSQPDLWRLQWGGLWRHWAPAPLLEGPLAILRSMALRYGEYYWGARYHRYLFEVPFLIAGLVFGLRQGGLARGLSWFVVVFHLCLALLSSLFHAEYMFAVYPLACVLIAMACFGGSRRAPKLLGISLFAFYLLQTGYWVAKRPTPLPERVRAAVLARVGGQTFLAADNLWFSFPNERGFHSVVAAHLVPLWAPDLDRPAGFEKYLRQQQIEFIVMDSVFDSFLTPLLPGFLDQRATLIEQFPYGRGQSIKIFRIRVPG